MVETTKSKAGMDQSQGLYENETGQLGMRKVASLRQASQHVWPCWIHYEEQLDIWSNTVHIRLSQYLFKVIFTFTVCNQEGA